METRLRDGLRVKVRIGDEMVEGEVRKPRVEDAKYVFDFKADDGTLHKRLSPIAVYDVLEPKKIVAKRGRK